MKVGLAPSGVAGSGELGPAVPGAFKEEKMEEPAVEVVFAEAM